MILSGIIVIECLCVDVFVMVECRIEIWIVVRFDD